MQRNTLGGQLWAEFLGTTLLVLFGNGVVANVVFATRLGAGGYDWNTITLGWAFAVAMAVYVAGGITGAHLNPAVTIASLVRRSIGAGPAFAYIGVQVLGAIVASWLVHTLYAGSFAAQGYNNVFYTAPAPGYESFVASQYLTEIIGTFCLVLFISAIVDNVRNVGPGANLWPFMVGMAVLAIGLSLGGPTGYAINPARDFGPRLYASLFAGDAAAFTGAYWLVPIIGPLIGGVLGALCYDYSVKPFLPEKDQPDPDPEGVDVAHAPVAEAQPR